MGSLQNGVRNIGEEVIQLTPQPHHMNRPIPGDFGDGSFVQGPTFRPGDPVSPIQSHGQMITSTPYRNDYSE